MSDEEKKEISESDTWKNLDEVLAEINSVHFIQVAYRKKKIKFGWKELTEAESIPPLSLEKLQVLPEKEREEQVAEWLKKDFLAKVAKAGKIADCTNENVLTNDQWLVLPKRIRNLILAQSLDTRDALMSDFLSA